MFNLLDDHFLVPSPFRTATEWCVVLCDWFETDCTVDWRYFAFQFRQCSPLKSNSFPINGENSAQNGDTMEHCSVHSWSCLSFAQFLFEMLSMIWKHFICHTPPGTLGKTVQCLTGTFVDRRCNRCRLLKQLPLLANASVAPIVIRCYVSLSHSAKCANVCACVSGIAAINRRCLGCQADDKTVVWLKISTLNAYEFETNYFDFVPIPPIHKTMLARSTHKHTTEWFFCVSFFSPSLFSHAWCGLTMDKKCMRPLVGPLYDRNICCLENFDEIFMWKLKSLSSFRSWARKISGFFVCSVCVRHMHLANGRCVTSFMLHVSLSSYQRPHRTHSSHCLGPKNIFRQYDAKWNVNFRTNLISFLFRQSK